MMTLPFGYAAWAALSVPLCAFHIGAISAIVNPVVE
jgi:hypothetical protein